MLTLYALEEISFPIEVPLWGILKSFVRHLWNFSFNVAAHFTLKMLFSFHIAYMLEEQILDHNKDWSLQILRYNVKIISSTLLQFPC